LSKFSAKTNLMPEPTEFSEGFQKQRIQIWVKVPFFVPKIVIIFVKKGIL